MGKLAGLSRRFDVFTRILLGERQIIRGTGGDVMVKQEGGGMRGGAMSEGVQAASGHERSQGNILSPRATRRSTGLLTPSL